MEIVKVFSVSKDLFMSHIMKSLRYELDSNNAANLQTKEGIEYSKEMSNRFGSKGTIKVKVVTLNDHQYNAEFYSSEGITKTSYYVKDIDDNSCEVTYAEDFEPKTKTKGLNYKLMTFLYKRRNNKRVKILLNAIENHLLEESKNG